MRLYFRPGRRLFDEVRRPYARRGMLAGAAMFSLGLVGSSAYELEKVLWLFFAVLWGVLSTRTQVSGEPPHAD